MKKSSLYLFSFLILLNISTKNLVAQTVKAIVDTNTFLIADTFSIQLQVTASAKSQITWPLIDSKIGELEVNLNALSDIDSLVDGNSTTYSQRIVVTSFDTGYFPIPAFDFIIDKDTFSTNPQIVKIVGIEIDTTNLAIKPIKENLKEPITFMDIFWPYGAIVLAILLILAGIYAFFKFRKKSVKPLTIKEIKIPAHVWALEELEKLNREQLWQSGEVKSYYIRISDIFRQYLELRYHQPALESTTPEIMDRLKLLGLEKSTIEKVKSTLTLSDYVKFAKAKPLVYDHEQCFETVKEFVILTKLEETKVTEGL